MSRASSSSRPTSGDGTRRPDSARSVELTPPTTSNTSTGWARPLTLTGPIERVRTRRPVMAMVSALASTVPGLASCSRRDARWTVCPTAESADGSEPRGRSTTSPELRPTRMRIGIPCGPLDVVAVRGDPLLHPERGVARADRVVLLGDGRAEQRHDPIAQHLGHGALPAAHRLDHVLDDLVEERRGLLGVVARQHRHRRGDVGEEDADVLALPGQIRARSEEIGHALRVVDGRWERHPAVRAESRPRRRSLSASSAAHHSAFRRRSSGTPARLSA